MLHPKKVGTLPIENQPHKEDLEQGLGKEQAKQTNEIGMFTAVLDAINIAGKDISADALLTQRKLATYLVGRQAHYHFTHRRQPAYAALRYRAAVPDARGSGLCAGVPT